MRMKQLITVKSFSLNQWVSPLVSVDIPRIFLLPLATIFLGGYIAPEVSALPSRNIAQKAEKVIVQIETKESSQTGVLIGRSYQRQWVLTCQQPRTDLSRSQIYLGNQASPPLTVKQIRHLPNPNLVLLAVASDEDYPLAFLGTFDDQQIGDRIYVAGFVPRKTDRDRPFQFTEGIIASIKNTANDQQGFTHTSFLYPGMVGSPIFDSEARLIGLDCDTIPSATAYQPGLHWGAALEDLRDFAQQFGISLESSSFFRPSSRPPLQRW